jgi:hypothetical protein
MAGTNCRSMESVFGVSVTEAIEFSFRPGREARRLFAAEEINLL